jgi:methionine sulfoxide reductase catalytic subunit
MRSNTTIKTDILSSEITPEADYINRRQFIHRSAQAAIGLCLPYQLVQAKDVVDYTGLSQPPLVYSAAEPPYQTREKQTPFEDAASYNNFYEFGMDKSDPKRYASAMTVSPWSVDISGEVEKPGHYHLEDIIKPHALQERIYRLRCVEAWSMVIPWVGFPLADLLKRFSPTSKARYVAFETLNRPSEMRGQRSRFSTIDWPYVEGLRIDEAMHPLTILAVGMYGKTLPNQNGAPLRLVVPWKYGFKSIKSITRIHLTEQQPPTSWNLTAPNEYGFYSNVNPSVNHPRWSQATERRLPNSLFKPNRINTLPFNGYAEQVASLYKGMNLTRYF